MIHRYRSRARRARSIDLTEAKALLDRFATLTQESGSADERAAGDASPRPARPGQT
jgi:hypothetical protein